MDYWAKLVLPLVLLSGWTNCLQTDYCEEALGMQNNKIKDDRISASSYYDNAVIAFYGRAHSERGGGAWCPRKMIHSHGTEYIEIDMRTLHVLTKVEVQGRFGNGQGREYAEKYKLQYWREGFDHWINYKDGTGNELLEGNSNTYLAKATRLKPPVIVSRIRFVPYSDHPRTICMRVEVYGCPYTDGLISYSMVDGDVRNGDHGLKDLTFDGNRVNGKLSGGLGQLTDGEIGHTNFRVNAIGKGSGYEWVGWKNDSRGDNPVEVTFEFDAPRNFTAVHIYTNNLFTRDARTFSGVRVLFSAEGDHFTASPPVDFTYSIDRIFEKARNISINLHNSSGKFVKVQFFFSMRWLMISEITFDSVLCNCNLTDGELLPVMKSRNETKGVHNPIYTPKPSSGLMLGSLVTLGVVFGIGIIVFGIYYYKIHINKNQSKNTSLTSTETRKVSMKMKDLHINMSLSPSSNGYSRSMSKLYGHIHMDEEITAMYHEPYKGHDPGYFMTETLLKCEIDDYAVPDMNMTPPPPFSDVYIPPPPVPLSRPPATLPGRGNPSLVPSIPPPPEKQYYAATQLCQASNIQGVTGSVIFSILDTASIREPEIVVPEIPRHRISVIENLGEGLFGTVQLCEVDAMGHPGGSLPTPGRKKLAVFKALKPNASEMTKEDFRSEIQLLSQLNDPNIVRVVAVVSKYDPLAMLLEYLDHGDLFQFLRCHVSEGISVRLPATINGGTLPPVLSYGALVYIGTQIASGMKYLEDLNYVHRDLATRNCLVGRRLTVKISDFGMSRPLYSNDYYRIEGHALLPVRWMAWESVIQGRFTPKSDVWSFGVTLWEILSMARKQPFDEFTDEGVIENVSHCLHDDQMILLAQPPLCPREIYEMMVACWRTNEVERPQFWEILMFLQRKNLSFSIDFDE